MEKNVKLKLSGTYIIRNFQMQNTSFCIEYLSVKLPQEKAGSHTSKYTANFLENVEQNTVAIPFIDITTKCPDVSVMNFALFDF